MKVSVPTIFSWPFIACLLSYPVTFFYADYAGYYAVNYYFGLLTHERNALTWIFFTGAMLFVMILSTGAGSSWRLSRVAGVFFLILALFAVWGNFSLLWSISPGMSILETRLWVGVLCLAAFCLAAETLGFLSWKVLILFLALQTVLLSVPVVYAYFLNEYYVPYITLHLNRSVLSEVLLLALPPLMGLRLMLRRGWLKFCLGGLVFVSWASVVMMAQRAPMYGLIAGLSAFLLLTFMRWKNLRKKVAGGLIFLLLIALYLLYPHPMNSELQNWDSSSRAYNFNQAAETFRYRIHGAIVGFYQWKSNPWLGTGLGTFSVAYPVYAPELGKNGWEKQTLAGDTEVISRAHCEPVQVAGELGFVGLCLWAGIFIIYPGLLIYWGYRRGKILPMACGCAMGALTVSSLASSFGPRVIVVLVPYVLVGLLGGVTLPAKCQAVPSGKRLILLLMTIPVFGSYWALSSLLESYSVMDFMHQIESRKHEKEATFERKAKKYARLIEADPDNPVSYILSGNNMAQHGRLADPVAALMFQRAREKGLHSIHLAAFQSQSLYLAGQKDEAREVLVHALLIHPRSALLHALVAAQAEDSAQEEAESLWSRAQTLAPDDTEIVRILFREMFTGKHEGMGYEKLFSLRHYDYQMIRLIYAYTHPQNRILPEPLYVPEKQPWQ